MCENRQHRQNDSIDMDTANSEELENRIKRNRTADLQYVGEILKHRCAFCGTEPLLLSNVQSKKRIGFLSIFKVKCENCGNVTSLRTQKSKKDGRGIEINQMAVMGSLHSGLGVNHLESLMASVEVPFLSEQGYKKVEIALERRSNRKQQKVVEELLQRKNCSQKKPGKRKVLQ